MKYNLIILTVFIMLITVVVDRAEDVISDTYFKEEAITFMQKGGRNTAENGIALCERVNKLEVAAGLPSCNCKEIYDVTPFIPPK